MKNLYEHTQSRVLIIPQALAAMKDIRLLMRQRHGAIYYKSLEKDLRDIEFYTNTPCFIYIEHGQETLLNQQGDTIILKAGQGIFLPQGQQLHSDFVKRTQALSAYLVFFEPELINDYLYQVTAKPKATRNRFNGSPDKYDCVIEAGESVKAFFTTLAVDIDTPSYLQTKLVELLHLLAWQDTSQQLLPLLAIKTKAPTTNLVHLLEQSDVLHLSVGELAQLCGRSLSSFQRDFKSIYQMSPKQWLQAKRLAHAKHLLEGQSLSVTEVAGELGFDNISHFIKAFKQRYGHTPKQISKQ